MKKSKKIGIGILLLSVTLSLLSCGAKKSKFFGLWLHTCDGQDGSRSWWDSDEDEIAIEELLLREDGTFRRKWVDRYYTWQGEYLASGEFAHSVFKWGESSGKWEIQDTILILDCEETTGKESYQELEVEFNEDKTVLKVDGKSYKKRK